MSRRLTAVAVALALAWACADPPDKEMHQARGAIDAARAAGAERYAPVELAAATTALTRAEAAVAGGDYRLALSQALESISSAQAAARTAADQKAIVRSDTEHTLATLDQMLSMARDRLKTARPIRVAAMAVATLDAAVAATEAAVQEALTALAREDYLTARDALIGVRDRLTAAITDVDAALGARRRR